MTLMKIRWVTAEEIHLYFFSWRVDVLLRFSRKRKKKKLSFAFPPSFLAFAKHCAHCDSWHIWGLQSHWQMKDSTIKTENDPWLKTTGTLLAVRGWRHRETLHKVKNAGKNQAAKNCGPKISYVYNERGALSDTFLYFASMYSFCQCDGYCKQVGEAIFSSRRMEVHFLG